MSAATRFTCTQLRLTALSRDAAAPLTGSIPLPDKILVCPWGTSHDLSGQPLHVNEATLAQLVNVQKELGFEEIALDFNHATVGEPDKKGSSFIPVAAYGTLSVVEGEGIYFHPTSWTPEGESAWTGKHYKDLSPTIGRNDKNEVIFLHSVALCRQGQISGLTAYAVPTVPTQPTPPQPKHTTMIDYKAALLKLLKLPDDATDEAIAAAAEAPAATEKEVEIEVTPMSADAVIARLDRIERSALVDRATAAGKVIPLSATQIDATPVETLRSMIERIPATVPLSATVAPSTAVQHTTVTALSAEEKDICQKLNITEDQYRAQQ